MKKIDLFSFFICCLLFFEFLNGAVAFFFASGIYHNIFKGILTIGFLVYLLHSRLAVVNSLMIFFIIPFFLLIHSATTANSPGSTYDATLDTSTFLKILLLRDI